MSATTTTTAEATLASAVRRAAALEVKVAEANAERDAAIVALRRQGLTLAAIARLAGMSEPGVHKLLRRQAER